MSSSVQVSIIRSSTDTTSFEWWAAFLQSCSISSVPGLPVFPTGLQFWFTVFSTLTALFVISFHTSWTNFLKVADLSICGKCRNRLACSVCPPGYFCGLRPMKGCWDILCARQWFPINGHPCMIQKALSSCFVQWILVPLMQNYIHTVTAN
jgi:hypothetical protein